MKYLIWKNDRVDNDVDDYADHADEEQRHCDCTCCRSYSKHYKNEYLNVLCTGDSYAELFDGDIPRDPIRQTIQINQTRYIITKVSCIENDMIEVSAKKSDVEIIATS